MVPLWEGQREVRHREITRFNNMVPTFVANFGHKGKDETLHFLKEEVCPWKMLSITFHNIPGFSTPFL